MKKIPLTQGKFALVDDVDFEKLNRHKWCALKSGNTFYAIRHVSDKTKKSGQTNLRMHSVVLGAKKGEICDHVNRNGLDNQRKNLRIASRSLNSLNSSTPRNNTSGFKGVSRHKVSGKWQAEININGKGKYLGLFDTAKKASIAYQKAFKIRMKELT